MTTQTAPVTQGVTAPRSAAIAGIAFALLFATSMVLFQSGLPDDPSSSSAYDQSALDRIGVAVRIIPFAGIAFLLFLGVMRSRLGSREDQFVATVMLASGILFVAMVFVAFAFVGGMTVAAEEQLSQGYTLNQQISQQVFNVYALKMAAVFMAALATLWRKTAVMPTPLAILTLVLALVLLVSTTLNPWMVLVFPSWVLIISIYLLITGATASTAHGTIAHPVG